jgi:hypothetical protein
MKAQQSDLYDSDFYEWTQQVARLVREGRASKADLEHVAEEIEDMGKSEVSALSTRIRSLLMHLLKYNFQPVKRSRSWESTIANQRFEIQTLLEQSPSLKRRLSSLIGKNYKPAVRLASIETGLSPGSFPGDCPYTIEQILDHEWLP